VTLRIKKYGLDFYVQKLKDQEPYSIARYGNGEWGCILGSSRRTGSGSQSLTIPLLRHQLAESLQRHLSNDNYFLGLQSPGYLDRCGVLRPLKKWLSSQAPTIKWHDGNVFHHASMRGTLYPLIAQLRKMELVVVGPRWLQGLKKQVFPNMKFVFVRRRDCFETADHILAGIIRALKTCKASAVVSFSAGPTSKTLIYALHRRATQRPFLLDFGSLWDPYVGKRSRRYHKRLTDAVIKRNLTGRK